MLSGPDPRAPKEPAKPSTKKEIGKKVVVLIWVNASRHICREVRRWLGSHNREVKESGEGVRIISFLLPKQSPWLNAIERKWVDGKRKVVEPYGLLGAYELAERICRVFGCPHYEHLSVAQKVACSCTRELALKELEYLYHRCRL